MERLLQFLPSLLILGLIALISIVYLRFILKKWKTKLQSIAWCRENSKKNFWRISVPLLYIHAPVYEELIFRAPLVLLFDHVSESAWLGIFISALLFGASHWWGFKIIPQGLYAKPNVGEETSDNYLEEAKRLQDENKKTVLIQRVIQVCLTFGLGLLAGYYSIVYQSIWVAFGIHSLWNIVGTLLLPWLVALIFLAGFAVVNIFDAYKDRWKRVTGQKPRPSFLDTRL